MPKINLAETLYTGLGLIGGTMIATTVQKHLTILPPKVVAGLELAGGIMFTSNKSPLIRGIAWGVAGAGAIGLGHEFGVLHGVDEMVAGLFGSGHGGSSREEIMYLNGLSNEQTIGGLGNETTIGDDINGATYADYMGN